ncbi:hypothetical protein OSB04_010825 [Centaurea solstitialis]|uniref:GAG-pre-integrase domain-containing protein n=1 Tax=Centaurea solstitialis TaxID=347529 RepID=A0AA38TJ13_9ASTR|nr:hypothetical protein OSB04_010825 [Centaurea solstitialis]
MSYTAIPFYSPEESLRLIMGKWKLTGQNFPIWKMHLENILNAQGKRYVIEKPISRPKCNSPEKDFADYFKFMADESDVMSILSFSTSPEVTVDLRVKYFHEVVKNIESQVGFYKNSRKYLIMKKIYSLKLEKGQSVKDHLMEMRRLFKSLSRMGYKMVQEELVHLMWFSLPDEIRTIASLASLEPRPAAAAELMDSDWIDELGDLSCPECGSKDICAHSMNIDQLDIGLPDTPGIFMIDCLITSYESWVLDTGSGNHICNHLQGFKIRETLRKDRSNLRVGEGTMLVAEALGSYNLRLPSGLVLELENCYYVPRMIKNIISFDLLVDQATPTNGLYVLNLQENKEVYHISKRSKEIEDQTYLWHCRLSHINKKRIEQLQKGGLLGSFDFRPFNNCESCLSGKMTNQPFNKDNKRVSEFKGGYRYFITFTDDFSRYGYVYLIRHKSEAFERLKEFQNEVQNQLTERSSFCGQTDDNSKIIHVLVLEALERKDTKSCEKSGKKCKKWNRSPPRPRSVQSRAANNLTVPSGKNDTWTFLDYIGIDQRRITGAFCGTGERVKEKEQKEVKSRKSSSESFEFRYGIRSTYVEHPQDHFYRANATDNEVKSRDRNQGFYMIKELTFDGKGDSNTITHIESFEEICDLFKTEANQDAVRFRLFPLTLAGDAKAWLRSLEPSSTDTWNYLRSKFLSRFFPPSKIEKLRANIRSFRQDDDETIYEAWESGLNYFSRGTLDSSAGGVFMYKTPMQGYNLLEDMLIHNIDWKSDKRLRIPKLAGKISTEFDPSRS